MTASLLTEAQLSRRKRDAARWSLASNATLLALKIVVGALTGSAGILAEAVNSAADLFGSVVAFLSVRASDEPPDRVHAYGHGKIENLSGAATALADSRRRRVRHRGGRPAPAARRARCPA